MKPLLFVCIILIFRTRLSLTYLGHGEKVSWVRSMPQTILWSKFSCALASRQAVSTSSPVFANFSTPFSSISTLTTFVSLLLSPSPHIYLAFAQYSAEPGAMVNFVFHVSSEIDFGLLKFKYNLISDCCMYELKICWIFKLNISTLNNSNFQSKNYLLSPYCRPGIVLEPRSTTRRINVL